MKKLKSFIFIACTSLTIFSSCTNESPKKKYPIIKEPITISFTDTSEDGRPFYDVYVSDSLVANYLYAEEIAKGLIDGRWKYDETLEIK